VAAVKVGRIDGKFILNPTYEEIEKGSLELIVAGTPEGIIMIESGCNQESEEVILEAIKFGQTQFEGVFRAQRDLQNRLQAIMTGRADS
jgi:polyribonucleotide nucleotidyltransferase